MNYYSTHKYSLSINNFEIALNNAGVLADVVVPFSECIDGDAGIDDKFLYSAGFFISGRIKDKSFNDFI